MNRIFKIALPLLAICLTTISQPAHAQFWKKLFGTEDKKPKKTITKKAEKPPEAAPVKAKKTTVYPDSKKEDTYTIDVLLPLYLNTLVKDGKPAFKKTPDYAMGAINFYEGLTLAATALNNQHLKLQINIHDITDASEKPEALIASHKLDNSHLILGYVQSNDIPELAKFAKQKQINFISALSPSDADVKENPYFILIQPTLSKHLEQLVAYALDKHSKEPKFILHSKNSGGETEAYQQIKKSLHNYKDVKEIDCSQFNFTTAALAKNFDSTKTNVLFVSTLDITNTEKILNALAKLPRAYHFEIFGMPSWKYLKGLTQSSGYMELSIHYTSPFYYDPTIVSGKYVNTEYEKTYGGEPSEMVYRGYETIYWLGHLMEQYGVIFNPNLKDVSAAPFTRYDIKPTYSKDNDFLYQENDKLYMFHYQNGGYVVDMQ
jgi:hypothetical protein